MKLLRLSLVLAFGFTFTTAGASSDLEPNEAAPAAEYEAAPAAEYEEHVASQMVRKHFLVIGTFKSVAGARRAVARLVVPTGLSTASDALEIHEGEPTYPRDVCELNGWDYPCYVARGRFDDGAYLSVEPSDAYTGMNPGYFVVVAASGSRDDVLAEQRELARRKVPSYVQTSDVWLGCIH